MVQRVMTVNDVLEGHFALDIECLDRIYLNACVPILQTSAQVVAFLSGHLGFPFPSPVLFRQLGDRFRRAVASFAEANEIPWVRFGKDQAKLEAMGPHLARQAAPAGPGWPRSAWPRSSSGCRPRMRARPLPGRRGGRSPNRPAGDLLLLLPVG
jgi:hypothetical protein